MRGYYCSYYNSVWLILNDIIVGSSYGLFLMEHSTSVSSVLLDFTEVGLLLFSAASLILFQGVLDSPGHRKPSLAEPLAYGSQIKHRVERLPKQWTRKHHACMVW